MVVIAIIVFFGFVVTPAYADDLEPGQDENLVETEREPGTDLEAVASYAEPKPQLMELQWSYFYDGGMLPFVYGSTLFQPIHHFQVHI